MTTTTRGGPRPKVRNDDKRGRPLLDENEPTVRKTITLPASQAAELECLGDGNLSAGIRMALKMEKVSRGLSDKSRLQIKELVFITGASVARVLEHAIDAGKVSDIYDVNEMEGAINQMYHQEFVDMKPTLGTTVTRSARQ